MKPSIKFFDNNGLSIIIIASVFVLFIPFLLTTLLLVSIFHKSKIKKNKFKKKRKKEVHENKQGHL